MAIGILANCNAMALQNSCFISFCFDIAITSNDTPKTILFTKTAIPTNAIPSIKMESFLLPEMVNKVNINVPSI